MELMIDRLIELTGAGRETKSPTHQILSGGTHDHRTEIVWEVIDGQ